MALIIMNLLVGLTVNKIEELIKTGEKIQASKRVEDIFGMAKIIFKSQVEKYLSMCVNWNWMPKRIIQMLNQEKSTKVTSVTLLSIIHL